MRMRVFALALAGVLALGLSGCRREPVNLLKGVSPIAAAPSGEPEGWTAAVNSFALRLLQEGTPGADFSAMASYGAQGETLYLGKVSHRTAVTVGEEGTRAGAVAEAEMYVSSAPPAPSLWFNRPFLYLILDVEAGTPLFIGTLVELGP